MRNTTEIHSDSPNDMNEIEIAPASDESAQQLHSASDSQQPDIPRVLKRLMHKTCKVKSKVEDGLTININEMIQDCGDGRLKTECCIYKVPILLRNLKEEAYTPKLISIGPFHYRSERLQDMEKHKQILFKRFTQRAESSLDDLVRCVKHLEPKVRASYSETINLTEQELVKLTLMDAGFIIEFFIMFTRRDETDHDAKLSQPDHDAKLDGAKLSQPWLVKLIRQDLTLLENQLPFFVIEEVFNKAFPPDRRGNLPSFLELACRVFEKSGQKLEPCTEFNVKHFTDLRRLSFFGGKVMPNREPFLKDERRVLSYNANALQEAGIKLKFSLNKCLLDLKFSRQDLEIRQLTVDDGTEIVFRNMIALEQCHYPHEAYIADYAHVLDSLVDTRKDVDLLVHSKIVNHSLGDSNDVALLFNSLCKNVYYEEFNSEHLDICKKLNEYCEDPWHKKKATLRRDYCNTPWRTVASIAGIILLVLTIVQTIFSVLQVVLQK